mgnify:CR=1 FL=1
MAVPTLLWLRQDLRLADNPALATAVATKLPVALLYILDDETPDRWRLLYSGRWYDPYNQNILKADVPIWKRAGRPGRDDRNFLEAVLWWRRTGAPWRDLPSDFGPWKTVFNRFDRWASQGIWQRLFETLRQDPDDEWHSIDSTINRAHQHAAGAKGGLRSTASVALVAA